MFRLVRIRSLAFFLFFNDTATTEIYTLSLHDALPISAVMAAQLETGTFTVEQQDAVAAEDAQIDLVLSRAARRHRAGTRSEEHTAELQSPDHLLCRLLLEKQNPPTPPPL